MANGSASAWQITRLFVAGPILRSCPMLSMLTKEHLMYRIFMLNFGYYIDFATDNLDEAMQKAVDIGFDVAVCNNETIVKIHRMIGGWS
jgi:hypothetical protein